MWIYIPNENRRKIVEFCIISKYNTNLQRAFFSQFVSLFDQIGVEKLQNPLFKTIRLHPLYIFR